MWNEWICKYWCGMNENVNIEWMNEYNMQINTQNKVKKNIVCNLIITETLLYAYLSKLNMNK